MAYSHGRPSRQAAQSAVSLISQQLNTPLYRSRKRQRGSERARVILTFGQGVLAIYTSYIVGEVKLAYPEVAHYADAGKLLMGRFGYEIIGAMFVLQLTFLVGAHCLTGTIAFLIITDNGACSVNFGVVSSWQFRLDRSRNPWLYRLCIHPLGHRHHHYRNGHQRLSAVNWSVWPKENLTFAEAFIAITNVIFAYSFSLCQFSFMDEIHTPRN
jgi:hypothetical protein